jgi:hypothetical protein
MGVTPDFWAGGLEEGPGPLGNAKHNAARHWYNQWSATGVPQWDAQHNTTQRGGKRRAGVVT